MKVEAFLDFLENGYKGTLKATSRGQVASCCARIENDLGVNLDSMNSEESFIAMMERIEEFPDKHLKGNLRHALRRYWEFRHQVLRDDRVQI